MTESKTETVMFTLSPEFKEALDAFSGDLNESRSQTIRNAVAIHIGYDIAGEPKVSRQRKYANAEERRKATLERAKARRHIVAQLVKAYEAKDSENDIAALLASLKEANED